jgi:hypothetical protein
VLGLLEAGVMSATIAPLGTQPSASKAFYVYSQSLRDKSRPKATLGDRISSFFGNIFVGNDIRAEVFVAGQVLVEQQTNFHKAPGNLFYSLLNDDLETFKKKCRESGRIQERDPVGACVFHIAYLYQKYAYGQWLIKEYPLDCHKPYDRPETYDGPDEFLPYTGENILHMTIAQRALEETEVILRTYSEWHDGSFLQRILQAKTSGYFFQPGGEVGDYFGEIPLMFAVSSNWIEMVELILKYSPPDVLWSSVDSHGNNSLHMCVLHNLHEMYAFLVRKAGMFAEAMEEQLNNKNHSPFTLAAVTGENSMFIFLLKKRKAKCWTYGPVSRYIVDLEGLDQPHGLRFNNIDMDANNKPILKRVMSSLHVINPFSRYKKEPSHYGAIEYMCIHGKLEMLEIPEIQEIIRTKWERVGFPQFKLRFIFYIAVTLMLTLIVCLFQFQKGNTFLPWFVWCLFVTVFLVMLSKFLGELPDMHKQGFAYWGFGGELEVGTRGAAQLDNLCSSIEFLTFGIACFIKVLQYFDVVSVASTDSTIRVFLSITVVTSWIYLYFFLLGFEMTGVFVVIVGEILSSDLPKFMSLFVIVLFGFGISFSLLHFTSGNVGSGFHNMLDSVWSLFVYTITGGNEGIQYYPYNHGDSPRWFYVGMVMLYNLCIVFLMLNLLIAMMSKTYDQLLEKSKLIVFLEKYNIMCSFERGFSEDMKDRVRSKYGSVIWSPEHEKWKFFFQMEDKDPSWIKEKMNVNKDRIKYGTTKTENGNWKMFFEMTTSDSDFKEKMHLSE